MDTVAGERINRVYHNDSGFRRRPDELNFDTKIGMTRFFCINIGFENFKIFNLRLNLRWLDTDLKSRSVKLLFPSNYMIERLFAALDFSFRNIGVRSDLD